MGNTKQKNIDVIVANLTENIKGLKLIYLYGSRSKQQAHLSSDWDLAFYSELKTPAIATWEISNKLAALLNADVDLVNLTTTTVLKFEIISTGTCLYAEHGFNVPLFERNIVTRYIQFNQDRKPIIEAIKKDLSVYG